MIRQNNGKPVMWKTGHSFIKAKVREDGAIFGGELSGHFFFCDNFYGHDDGANASLRLLAYLTRVNLSLKEAISKLIPVLSIPAILPIERIKLADEKINFPRIRLSRAGSLFQMFCGDTRSLRKAYKPLLFLISHGIQT